jgi:hypothetical protein
MCTDYARGIIVAQLFFPGKFGLNMSYWGIKPTPPPTTPIETYIIAGLVVVVIVLIVAIFLTRKK